MRQHTPMLRRCAMRILKNEEDADDVLQDAFIKAFVCIDQYRGEAQIGTWLYAIVKNLSFNMLTQRKRKSMVIGNVDDDGYEIYDGVNIDTPEAILISAEVNHLIWEAVDKMPVELGLCLLMQQEDEMDYQSIADDLDIPIGTVRSRIFRARSAIASHIQRETTPVSGGAQKRGGWKQMLRPD